MINSEYEQNKKIFLELIDKVNINNTEISINIKEEIVNNHVNRTWNIKLFNYHIGEIFLENLSNNDVIDMIEDVTGEDIEVIATMSISRMGSINKVINTFNEEHHYLVNKVTNGTGITTSFIMVFNKETNDSGFIINLFDGINSTTYEPVLINVVDNKAVITIIKTLCSKKIF